MWSLHVIVEVSSYVLDSGVFSDNLLRLSGSNYREAILIRLEKPLIKDVFFSSFFRFLFTAVTNLLPRQTLWIARRSTEMHSSVITGSQRLVQDPIKQTEQYVLSFLNPLQTHR